MRMTDLFSLAGRTALITGGSRGLGRMIAQGYLMQGARVCLSSRDAAACERAVQALAPFGEVYALPADVSTVDGARALAKAYARRERGLDILVNNAGAAWGAAYDEFPETGWDRVMDLNLKAPFFLTQAMTPLLQPTAGRILLRINDCVLPAPHAAPWLGALTAAGDAWLLELIRAQSSMGRCLATTPGTPDDIEEFEPES